jgi:hypothetical protein
MPGWLGVIAAWNPVSSTAGAIRELFDAPVVVSGYWIEGHAIVGALAWPLLIIAVFSPLAVRQYQSLRREAPASPGPGYVDHGVLRV